MSDNLIPLNERTKEEQREIARMGGIASGKARREKKLMSQIYADFLIKEHEVIGKDGIKKKLSGEKLLSSVMSKVLSRGDSSSVSLMKEIREAVEGSKMNLQADGNMNIVYLDKQDEGL
jgi:hypothetical protein